MAESFLAHGPAARKDRYLAMIHVDADVLEHDTDGRCELDDGPALSPDTARRIACDAPFITVLVDKLGKPMKVGKKSQAIPTRVERRYAPVIAGAGSRDAGNGCSPTCITTSLMQQWEWEHPEPEPGPDTEVEPDV